MSRIPEHVVEQVMLRSGGYCEMWGCQVMPGESFKFDLHHRQARGMGGSRRNLDVAENLLWVHDRCHEHIHAHPDWARAYGYIVSQFEETPA